MKNIPIFALLAAFLLSLPQLPGQTTQPTAPAQNQNSAGAEVVSGPKGFLSIDCKGGKFVIPFRSLVSLARHEFIVDGGGKVHELTIDTSGSVIARFYYLDTMLENNPLNAAQIVNNRIKKLGEMAEDRTGEDVRTVVKHYPETTHARTVEFNVSNIRHLDTIYDHVYEDWVIQNGRGDGRTLRIR